MAVSAALKGYGYFFLVLVLCGVVAVFLSCFHLFSYGFSLRRFIGARHSEWGDEALLPECGGALPAHMHRCGYGAQGGTHVL